MAVILILFFNLSSRAAESYYDIEPCRKFRVQDYPVAVLPWQETKSSVYSENCSWSMKHLQDLISLGAHMETKTLESAVTSTLNEYYDYQKDIAATLECCVDAELAESRKVSAPACIANRTVQVYCRGTDKGTGFKDYFKDINDRLKALRIAAYRSGDYPSDFENATKIPIDNNKPLIAKLIRSVDPEIVALGRIPFRLEPLSEEEVKLAKKILSGELKDSQFSYAKFVSQNPKEDYYTIMSATPFLGEISKRELSYADFKNMLLKFRERNKDSNPDFQDAYYRDMIGLVSESIFKVKDSSTQRMLCRHSEFRSNLAKLSVVVLKEIPLVVATIVGGLRGRATMPVGASMKEVVAHLGLNLGKTAPAGLILSGAVDLERSKQLDIYCGKKLSDGDMDNIAPLCNQFAILQSLEKVQENAIYAAGFSATLSGGMAIFRARKAKDLILEQSRESVPSGATLGKGVAAPASESP